MYQFNNSIRIIGWGDVPTNPGFSVNNQQALNAICERLGAKAAIFGNDSAALLSEAEKIGKLTAEDVTSKIGVMERQWWPEGTTSTHLAFIAANRAIKSAKKKDRNFSAQRIGIVVSGGSTIDDLYPCCAAHLQSGFEAVDCQAFDVSLACCSGSQALLVARNIMLTEGIRYGLVAVGETIGSRCNNLLTENALLWGDGGGAVVLENYHGSSDTGIQASLSRTNGSLSGTTRSIGIGAHPDHRNVDLDASMEGQHKTIYRWVLYIVALALKKFITDNEITITNRTFFLPHNGNLKMVSAVCEKAGIPLEQMLHRIPDRGNQSSASVLSTLAFYADKGHFQKGDQLLLATFGGGVAYNFIQYVWP